MNRNEFVAELKARGFDYLTPERAALFIQWACGEVDDEERWPYREATVIGTAPMTISDLGIVEAVVDVNANPLTPAEFTWLLSEFGDLSQESSASYYYVARPDGVPQIATYPVTTDAIGVQYWRETPDLGATDEPLAPSRFHRLIVNVAAQMAYLDNDEPELAAALQDRIDRDYERMRKVLLTETVQDVKKRIRITGTDY